MYSPRGSPRSINVSAQTRSVLGSGCCQYCASSASGSPAPFLPGAEADDAAAGGADVDADFAFDSDLADRADFNADFGVGFEVDADLEADLEADLDADFDADFGAEVDADVDDTFGFVAAVAVDLAGVDRCFAMAHPTARHRRARMPV